ncbi:MAG: DUF5716 family protein [Lachnospiraceae bacterium]
MAETKKLIIGIDLSKEYIQASYMTNDMEKPESVMLGFASQTYDIPTEGYKKKGENKWAFGDTGRKNFEEGGYLKVENVIDKVLDGSPIEIDDEKYMPADILECLFRFIVRECVRVTDIEKVSKIAICVDQFGRKLLDSITNVLGRMDIPREDVLLLNRTECFIYTALNTSEELYQRGVAMFDYSGRRLTYSYMNYAIFDGKTIVMVDSQKDRVSSNHPEEVDKELAELALKMMGNSSISSIYLTGKGFEKYDHLDKFVQVVTNRRRAFIGQNLYAEGAAQGAFEHFYGGNYKNRVLACEDRILSDIDIDIVEREKPKVYRAVKVGTNWYMANKKLRFIVDEAKEITLHVHPIERKPDQDIVISLEDFPKRPPRMTKVMLELDFASASECKVSVRDMGFGDIYKSTGKTVYQDIKL